MTDIKKIGERIWLFLGSKKGLAICTGVGLVAMAMILFSGGGDDNQQVYDPAPDELSVFGDDFAADTEGRLEEILSAIDGVGQVKVMVTVAASEEYVFAESGSKSDGKEESEYVIIKNGSEEEALVRLVRSPEITGVVVVCDGGGSDKVREDIYKAVAAALDIPSIRIYVAKMK